MNAIIDAAISHSRTVLLSLVLILGAGGFAYWTIPKEDSPDVSIPTLYVNMVHEGISPEDAERLLIKPVEKELRALEGVKEMTSTAYLGGANVVMEFDAGFDADKALADVREKVDLAKPELPEDTEEPTVHEINLSLFPVLTVSLAGSAPERTLLRIARDLQDRIESISSVLEAEIVGDRDELLEVIIDPVALESYNLDATDIVEMVTKSNLVVAAGALDTGQGRFAVKVPGLFETMEDIVNLPIKVSGDAVVRFRDVASLRRSFKDTEGFSRLNGQPSLALKVSKRSGENIIETIEQVRATVEAQRARWPETVTVAYSQDKSTDIRNNLLDLQNNIVSAILLVMVVVVAALGVRTACFVGMAIPGSFLAGILVLALGGLTVNMVVLFGLILAAGMLVDGAIVVTEYADRKMSEGLPKQEAYALAGKRMAWPVIASTATTLAAFLPLMFWPGVVGEFMKYLPLTLIATLTASLVMALIFVPTLGAVFGKSGGAADPATMRALAASEHGDLDEVKGWTGRYVSALGFALRHPGKVVFVAVLTLVVAAGAYVNFGRGVEFFPDVEPNNAVLQIHARGNLAVEERDTLVRQVEAVVLAMQRERGEFHAITAESMAASGQRGGNEAEDIIGKITLEFTDWFQRRPANEIFAEIRERSAIFGGVFVEARKEEAGPPVGKPVQVQVSSPDPALIEPAALHIAEAMRQMGGFVDIEDGTQIPGIEWELKVDRAQAAKFGADISLVGSYVRMITNGMKLGEYRPDDSSEEIDIVVRLPEQYRTAEQLDHIRMQTPMGLVPIANFVERMPKPRVGLLRRADGNRAMTVKADVAPGLLVDDKVREVRAWLAGQALDPRINIEFKGEDEEQKEASAFLGKAFAVALFLMAIILVTQFNSFYSAFLVLSAVIMSTVGVMIGLLITDQPFGIIMSGIGVIALAGIVVNNNIVLIDTFDRLRETTPAREAILRTGAQRLRPVMLTTVTTILGLMPMVLATNIDFFSRTITVGAPSTQWWRQLSTAVAFGLTFATLLTLVVTPSALMLKENLRAFRARRRQAKAAPADAERRGKPRRPVSEAAE